MMQQPNSQLTQRYLQPISKQARHILRFAVDLAAVSLIKQKFFEVDTPANSFKKPASNEC